MPLMKNLGLLLSEAIVMAVGMKVHKHMHNPVIIADVVQVEDVIAVMFCEKITERFAWVSEARQGEGILIFLASTHTCNVTHLSSGTRKFTLRPSAIRHVIGIDQYTTAADIILNYVVSGILP